MAKVWFTVIFIALTCLFGVLLSDGHGSEGDGLHQASGSMKPLPAAPSGVTAGGVDLLNIPLLFIENRGQADPEARFYAKAQGYTLWITPGGMVFDVVRREPDDGRGVAPPDVREMMGRERKPAARGVARLRFVGAHPSPEIVSEEAAALSVNVFRGSDPSRWRGGIPTSRAVRYKDLYPGIDLKVYGVGKQIEYDWIVAPGADPGRIRFSYGDAADARIDENGDLRVRTDAGDLVHRRPVTYQEIGGKRVAVVSAFRETAENICGFSVGDYDSRYPLVIDPVVLAYGTCLGGGGADIGWEVAVADDSGVVYVAGRTSSADFPVRDGFQEKPAGGRDHFIAKIDTTKRGAESLLWCSYLGGSGNEGAEYYECATLAADGAGHVYVAFYTDSSDFPTTPNAFQRAGHPGYDVVVAKMDTNIAGPASLVYATYLGGNGNDRTGFHGTSIAVDDKGIIHIAGSTYSTDFPTTPDAFRTTKNGPMAAFIVKLDPSGNGPSDLLYGTYLGGNKYDALDALVLDGRGRAWVTGGTCSPDFPVRGGFQSTPHGKDDAFVACIDTTEKGDAALVWSSYLGGSENEWGRGIALDGAGRLYLTGFTESPDFPVRGGFQSTPHGKDDAFVACIDTTEKGDAALVWSSYLGGSENDWGNWIPSDGTGRLYLSGGTESPDFPVTGGFQTALHGNRDGFVACLENTGELVWSSYLGGRSDDEVHGIALDGAGCIYVTGYTFSPDFPTRHAFQTKHPSESSKQDSEPDYWERDMDAFLVKLVPGAELTVGKAGTGKGRVTSDPPGIDCGTDCSEAYPYGMNVTLTAVPEEGFVAAWEGAGAGSKENSLTVTMDGPKTVTVRFDLVEYDLAVEKSGAGRGKVTSDPPGIDCGTDCSEAYPFGTEVTLTAVPGEGSVAVWEGAGAGSKENSLTVTVDGPKTVAVRFDLVEYDLAVEKSGAGRGKVTSDPPGIDCGTDCSETYPFGTEVALTAVPEEGSVAAWEGAGAGSKENSLTVTVDGPKTVAVRFDLVEYDLAVEKSGAGRGKVTSDPPGIDCGTDCSETYPYGTVVTLTAVPEESSLFEGWTGACTGHTCTVVMTDNQRVHAVFTERASVRPVIDYVVPATAVSGGPGFTLEVHGGMLRENAAVYWNGSPRKTEFVSAQQLKAEILPEDITAAGAMPVTVVNKTEIGASVESESMEFIVMDPRAIPTLDEYGMILLAVLLTGAALVLLRRRREGRGAPR